MYHEWGKTWSTERNQPTACLSGIGDAHHHVYGGQQDNSATIKSRTHGRTSTGKMVQCCGLRKRFLV